MLFVNTIFSWEWISPFSGELLLGGTHGSHLREPQVTICNHNAK